MSDYIKKKRSAIGEGIYLLYFAIMMAARAFGLYEGMTVYNISLVVGMLLFACKMVITPHSIKEYVLSGVLLLISVLVYLHTGEKGLLVCFTMMLGMKAVSVQKVIRTGIIVSGIAILIKIFTGVFGILPEIYYPQEREGIGTMFRHALGYAHPNTLHMNVLMLTMLMIFYISKGLSGKKDRDACIKLGICSCLAALFNLYIFNYSGSRTGILTCFVFLIINFWFFICKKPGILEKIVTLIAFPGVCFISIVMPLILPDSIFELIDRRIFTTRLSIARYFWSNNHISLFGIRLVNENEYYKTYGLDMAQLYLFLQLGILAFITIAALTMWFVVYCLKKNRLKELAVLLGMLCLGIWEPLLYNLGFKNFVYVFIGAAIYEALSGKESVFCDFDRPVFVSGLNISYIMKTLSTAALAGLLAMLLFLAVTSKPTALYGGRELDESGRSLGMEGYYFTADEIETFRDRGDLVVGYVDDVTPMYIYSEDIAAGEYEKKALSIAVFTAIALVILQLLFRLQFSCPSIYE